MASPFDAILGIGAQAQARSTPSPIQTPDQVLNQTAGFQRMANQGRQENRADRDQTMQEAQFAEQQSLAPYRRRQIEAALAVAERRNLIEQTLGTDLIIEGQRTSLKRDQAALAAAELALSRGQIAAQKEQDDLADEAAVDQYYAAHLKDPMVGVENLPKSGLTPRQMIKAESKLRSTALGKLATDYTAHKENRVKQLMQDPNNLPPRNVAPTPEWYINKNAEKTFRLFANEVGALQEDRQAVFRGLTVNDVVDEVGDLLPKYRNMIEKERADELRDSGGSSGTNGDKTTVSILNRQLFDLNKRRAAVLEQRKSAASFKEDTAEFDAELEKLDDRIAVVTKNIDSVLSNMSPSVDMTADPGTATPKELPTYNFETVRTELTKSLSEALGGKVNMAKIQEREDVKTFVEEYADKPPETEVPILGGDGRASSVQLRNLPEALKRGYRLDLPGIKAKRKVDTAESKKPTTKYAPVKGDGAGNAIRPVLRANEALANQPLVDRDPIGNALRRASSGIDNILGGA